MEPDRSEAFQAVYARHSREVWALAYARRLDASAAMDITQEAFLRLWQQWQAGEVIHHPRAWLLRVARNLAEDQAKSAFSKNGTRPPQTMTGLPAREAAPLDNLLTRERREQVRGLLAELAPPDREVLTLRYALDYDTPAIAAALGISPAAVLMRLSRARQRLADRLTDLGVMPDEPDRP